MFFDNLFDDFNPFGSYTYRQPRQQRPQTSTIYRNDNRSIMVRKLVNDEYNYMCFDCHRELSELNFFDLKNGIFLCNSCAQQHARLSKEITQPMTGSIRALEEKDLLILYYGGNKNLFDFIKNHFPLLDNMQLKEKYATKAMDYYRKLLRSKAYDETEPNMPGKKKAYTSIFQKKVSPARENHKNIRNRRIRRENDGDEEDNDDGLGNFFRSTFFGDDLFNRKKRNTQKEEEREEKERESDEEREKETEEDSQLNTEPAVLNKNENDELDDAGMKRQQRKISLGDTNEIKEENIPKTYRTIVHEPKIKKMEKKEVKSNDDKSIKANRINTLTINQIGELSNYPDAMEIDGMECMSE